MKKMSIWLGLSGLLVGLLVFPSSVLSETISSSDTTANSVSTEQSDTSVVSDTLSSELADSSGDRSTKTTETSNSQNENAVNSALIISNLSYDFNSKTISGKTTPSATVYVSIVFNGNGVAEPSAVAEADNNGNFSINHIFDSGQKISLTAQLNGVMGESTTFTIPKDPSLAISNLSYDFATKTVHGKTTPGASVYATLSSNTGPKADALVSADNNGNFSFVDQFSPGQEVHFNAYFDGAVGEDITFIIPFPAKAPTLSISDLSYDHATGVLSGKTAPNAAVGLTIPATMGQARIMSDENGNFSYKEEPFLAPGTVLNITAFLGEEVSETVVFTIPEKTTSTSTSDSATSSKPVGKTKKNLPETGENKSVALSILGLLTILSAPFIYKKVL